MTLRERMREFADGLENTATTLEKLETSAAGAYGFVADQIRRILEKDGRMEEDWLDRKICPLMSKADPDNPREVQPVFCLGGCCGMYALCQARIDLSGRDIKITPPAVPGL